ncbi:MATE family efflux transporter [Hespellia stercorisuis]|uniref:Putative efflux protein, MATE family n=1 Tax=Hespellia stercorisuis DSM 15480 TaxID=1121950 RepID=A0A1M6MER4_9FIRM|nr:MATE family efflux transporter [Hespellia stercorisuis]SHJ81830.1 putative efflux protein, MATE family [Hespellia stercorisuis DSM 15480]
MNTKTNTKIIETKENKQNFYKSVFSLVLPLALQNLINVSVSTADVVMLGKVGETALSASSLAGQAYFVMSLIFFGLTSGAMILVAQYWGKKNIEAIEQIMGITLRVGFIIAAIFTVVVLAFPGQIMRIFTNEQVVIAEGVKYLRIIACSYIIAMIPMVYTNLIRGVEQVVISTVVYGTSLMVNIVLNAIFIFGLLGCPAMGIRGAALGTVMARVVELLIVIVYDRKFNPVLKFQPKMLFVKNKELNHDFMTYAMPVILNELAWGCGMATVTAIVGRLGQAAVAANSVIQVGRQMAMILSFGVAGATSILVGKTIGEGKTELARIYAKRFVKMAVILGLFGAVIILIVMPVAGSFLTLSDQARAYLHNMTYVMSYFCFGQSINTILIVGIFRAGGDSKVGLLIDMGTLWGFSIVMGSLAAFVFKWPVMAVYVCLVSDEIVKLPFSIKRYRSYKWLNNVTRE